MGSASPEQDEDRSKERRAHRTMGIAVFLLALTALAASTLVLCPGLDEDSYAYLLWGRDLLRGAPLNRVTTTAPKPVPMAVAFVAQCVPGARGPERVYLWVTVAVGAALAAMVAGLARRLGGAVAGWLSVPLLLANYTYLHYVVNGQSTIYEAAFVLGALLLATRDDAGTRDYLLAALLITGAGLCRPEAAILGAALGLGVYLRLGWRRVGVPALVMVVAMSSVAINLLFYRIAFGSFTYTSDLALHDTVASSAMVPDPWIGFARQLVRTVVYFANRSWFLLFLAAVGAGVALGGQQRARFVSLLLFPPATAFFTWLLLHKGILFNVRCYHYAGVLVVVLAAAGAGQIAAWAASSGRFLSFLSVRRRCLALVGLVLVALAPTYLSRPLPTDRRELCRRIDAACVFLAQEIADQHPKPRIVAWDLVQAVYRLGLPPDEHFRFIDRIHKPGQTDAPWQAEWYLTEASFGGDPEPLPTEWGAKLVWKHPSGLTRVYHCDKHARNQKAGSTPGTVR